MKSSAVLLELGAVLLGLAVVGRVAGRFGLSAVPFYLVAGLLLSDDGPFPLRTTEEFVAVGASLGVVLLLLMLGLEFSAEELTHSLRGSFRQGLVDLLASFTPGFVLGLVLGWETIAAVLLGGITYMSSSGIIAKLLADLGRVGNRETPTVLGILVVEDLAMALYLPAVAAVLVGSEPARAVLTTAAAVLGVALVLVGALRYGEKVSEVVFTHSEEGLLLTVVGIALLVAGVAERIQVSAAVGAFLVGIAMSGRAAQASRPLLLPLRDLFAGVFFVFFGLEIDTAAVPAQLPVALALAVVTSVTKVATGWWAARRAGVGYRGAARAATVLIARGEFSVVIAGIGVSAGAESDLGALAAGYVLALAVAGPIVTRFADGIGDRVERRSDRSRAAPS